jgi:hypothetical protein
VFKKWWEIKEAEDMVLVLEKVTSKVNTSTKL